MINIELIDINKDLQCVKIPKQSYCYLYNKSIEIPIKLSIDDILKIIKCIDVII